MLRTVALLTVIIFLSCKNKNTTERITESAETNVPATKEPFFPVTLYLQGQINEIKREGVNPLKYTTVNNVTDSAWVKIEDLEKEMAPFLEPVIDSSSLSGLFAEKKFLDQTIDAYTFTYDPLDQLPENFTLQHWDVYVDPESGKVRRIYLLKQKDNKVEQLTWQNDKWAKIVTLATDKNGKTVVEKEVLIKWDF